MRGLIVDRTMTNVNRCVQLSNKGWENMTEAERAEWSGDPLSVAVAGYPSPVNLLPSVGEGVYVRDGSIYCESTGSITIGNTEDWYGRQVTLSCAHIFGDGSITLRIQANESAYVHVATLSEAGSMVVSIPTGITTGTVRLMFSPGYYSKVMLELHDTAHDYVPYYPILPTNATKGAYNYSDLNRVETVVRDIADLLGLNISVKTDWSMWDVPTRDGMNRYLNNLRVIRDRLKRTDALPNTLDRMTYTVANNIESFLEIAYKYAEAVYRVGDVFSGEV